jgi:DNA-binding transcriptional MerR regulator
MIFRITEAARRIGIHPCTLRSLEKRGMIEVQRDWAGYRVYSKSDIEQIQKKLFNENSRMGGARD